MLAGFSSMALMAARWAELSGLSIGVMFGASKSLLRRFLVMPRGRAA